MSVCKTCKKDFLSKTRHKDCSKCRYNKSKGICPDCGCIISKQAIRCLICYKKSIKGVKTPLDEYTGFREFINRAKRRNRFGDITLDDLLDVWNNQKGICPYSGVNLVLPSYSNKNNQIYVASLDRIDSSKKYSKGNIQFVSASLNYMKGQMTHDETIVLCKIIALFWAKKE